MKNNDLFNYLIVTNQLDEFLEKKRKHNCKYG